MVETWGHEYRFDGKADYMSICMIGITKVIFRRVNSKSKCLKSVQMNEYICDQGLVYCVIRWFRDTSLRSRDQPISALGVFHCCQVVLGCLWVQVGLVVRGRPGGPWAPEGPLLPARPGSPLGPGSPGMPGRAGGPGGPGGPRGCEINEWGQWDGGTTNGVFVIFSPSPLLACGDIMRELLQSKHCHLAVTMPVWKLPQSHLKYFII